MSLNPMLAGQRTLILDGGTGSELRRRGVVLDGNAWSAPANLDAPGVIQSIHEEFIAAGADIVTANTFGCARFVLESSGVRATVASVICGAVAAARRAREQSGAGNVLIAGSMSNLPPGFDRRRYPDRQRERQDYEELAMCLADAGVDLLLLEMVQDERHGAPLMEAAQRSGLPIGLGLSVRQDRSHRLVGYDLVETPLDEVLDALLPLGPDLVSIMHTATADVGGACRSIRRRYAGPLGIYPELPAAAPRDALASEVPAWARYAPVLLGGCCGTRPDQITALKSVIDSLP